MTLELLWRDFRAARHSLRRAPGIAIAVILTLALGIGANTAIFSLLDTLMLRPLPVAAPENLVELLSQYPDPDDPRMNGFSWHFYERFRDEPRVFSDLFGVAPAMFRVTVDGRAAEPRSGEYVTGNLFAALGIRPAIGRLIAPGDDQLGSSTATVVVLSWSYWQSGFDRDPQVIGRRITVDGVPATIVGVTERSFSGLQVGFTPSLWIPTAMEPLVQPPGRRPTGQLSLRLMGRLAPGVATDQARAAVAVINRDRVEELAQSFRNARWRQATLDVVPATAGFAVLRDVFAQPLVVLMAVVALLLLAACANIAGLLVARGTARQREMAIRVSLGASRSTLVRQVLAESAILSGTGGVLGIAIAMAGASALVRIIVSGRPIVGWTDRIQLAVAPDARVLLFTAAVAVITTVLFGLAPALTAFVANPSPTLREAGGVGEARSRRVLGTTLVVTQIALSAVLVSTATLLAGHLSALRGPELGFQRGSVLLVSLDPSRSGSERLALSQGYKDLLARLQTLPGVRSATFSAATPVSGAGAARFVNVEGFTERVEDRRYVSLNWVAPRYFETLGTPLLAGRDFQFADEGRPYVAIVNQSFARHYFGDARMALGGHVRFDPGDRTYEVVGVVGDAKYLRPQETPPRTMYLHAFQDSRGMSPELEIATAVAPSAVAGSVRTTVADVLKTVEVKKVTTLEDQVDAAIVPERLVASIASFFGGLGVLLAVVGLYGLLTHGVARRTSEIGLRMALGASPGRVTAAIVGGALMTALGGLAVSAPLAYWGQQLLAAYLPDLRGSAVTSLAMTTAMVVGVAVLAAYVPARRAARITPMAALRLD